MARADTFITSTREDVVRMLDLQEQAQAIAAARLQEYNSMSSADKTAIAEEFGWEAVEMTVSEFVAGMAALENMADILGANATALYKFKIELA